MHRLSRVELDHVAHPVTEGDEVAGLLREGVDDLAIRRLRLAHGDVPPLAQPGIDDRVRDLVAERRGELLPLHA